MSHQGNHLLQDACDIHNNCDVILALHAWVGVAGGATAFPPSWQQHTSTYVHMCRVMCMSMCVCVCTHTHRALDAEVRLQGGGVPY